MNADAFARAGGFFAVLAFVHFVVDWVFQTHAEAMAKHNNWRVRVRHCIIYTLGFVPLLVWVRLSPARYFASLAVLFLSHFAEDTYYPVFLWAKHVRRVPVVREKGIAGFVEWAETPLGKILMIAVDQIVHLTFLWVVVWMAMRSG